MNCPHCQRVLYSRQHPYCGWCLQKLPAGFRFSGEAVAQNKAKIREIDRRMAASRLKDEEERRERWRNVDPGVG